MIDTDKYEGHAEGKWTIEQNETGDECAINSQDYGTIAQTFYRDSDKLFFATARLIADAPLLLEEVERLREENKMLRHGINDAISMGSSGAKTPVADGSIKHYFPLYLLEMIE